ncbi:hypothetical protein Pla144_02080 [Bythopirellula polymerisocia]|uniref:Uncharacterized protein n=1 Tax=Bythopirellula polymerisocia TaxID=2528003 RepID=A0A5C6CXZ1_9BACT|nr:hypothetical protein Pla144_02080 [Bythopirellula polymerisocia]
MRRDKTPAPVRRSEQRLLGLRKLRSPSGQFCGIDFDILFAFQNGLNNHLSLRKSSATFAERKATKSAENNQ